MKKSYTSFVLDYIFYSFIIFLITLIWVRMLVHNHALIWIYSLSITLIISTILFIFLKKKIYKFSTNKKEEKEKEKILNQLIFAKNDEIGKFLQQFFDKKNIKTHKNYFLVNKIEENFENNTKIEENNNKNSTKIEENNNKNSIKNSKNNKINENANNGENNSNHKKTCKNIIEKTIIFYDFGLKKISCEKILELFKISEKEKAKTIIIFCSDYEKDCSKFYKNIKNTKIKLINFNNFYVNFIKKQEIYPNFEIRYEQKSKYSFKELLFLAFNKNKTKNYFGVGFIFLLGSIFMRYNIYYLIFTTLMFIFAFFSYFNSICNKNFSEISEL